MKIHIKVAALEDAQIALLVNRLAGHEVTFDHRLDSEDARRASVAAADVVFGNVPAAWLADARNLRWVQLDSAGADAYLRINQSPRPTPVIVTNLRDFYGRAVAEAALAGILAFYRQLPALLRAQPERRWVKPAVEPGIGQLHGARALVLGMGALGGRLAQLLRAFECEVTGFARTAPEAGLRTWEQVDAALPSADLVINTLPQTPATIGVFDRARFARFAPQALFVNVGRGSAVDEAALLAALVPEGLGGAVLDVTTVEPLPASSSLWTHPRVILTQHTGGRFPRETEGKIAVFLGNFERLMRGESLHGVVDFAKGY